MSLEQFKPMWLKVQYKNKRMSCNQLAGAMVAAEAEEEDSEEKDLGIMALVLNANYVVSLGILCGNATSGLITTFKILFNLLLILLHLHLPLFTTLHKLPHSLTTQEPTLQHQEV